MPAPPKGRNPPTDNGTTVSPDAFKTMLAVPNRMRSLSSLVMNDSVPDDESSYERTVMSRLTSNTEDVP